MSSTEGADELWTPTDAFYLPKTLKKTPLSQQLEPHDNETKVLVLFTGGTIGMMRGPSGTYEPFPNMLEAKLRTLPQLHDPTYSSTGPLVLPLSSDVDHHQRVLFTVYEYEPLLDSSNMTIDDWIRIALDIKRLYNDFDGFVILHGTDTMAFTASALSFMLQGLRKPVVITGSQIPIFETRTDGQDNFQGAIIMAAHYVIPEVTIYFNHRLFRGNRTTKVSTDQLNAFDSPNMGPLVNIGIDIDVDWMRVLRAPSGPQLRVHTNMSRYVSVLTIFPSIPIEIIKAHLEPPMKGVVLQSFGSGNVPAVRMDLMQALKEACVGRGVLIVNITQCRRGCVSSNYETGRPLLEAGVIPGSDLTVEAALTKLCYVIGRDDWDNETKIKMMQTNLRGEMWTEPPLKLKPSKLIKGSFNPFDVCDAIADGHAHLINAITEQAGLDCLDAERRSPLHVAASQGNSNVVQFLLQHGVEVNALDKKGRTPLDYAIRHKHHHVVHILHQYGAYLETNMDNLTVADAICSAAASGDVSVLGIYKKLGFDFNLRDSFGRTTLHQAVLNNRLDCVAFLLICGVSPLLQDGQGFSSYDLAMRLGLLDIETSLRRFAVN